MARRISIIGATITGNHGAEVMLAATVAQVRGALPDADITIFSYYPTEDKKHLPPHLRNVDIQSATPLALLMHFICALLFMPFRILGIKWFLKLMPKGFRQLAESNLLLDIQGVSFNDGRTLYLPFKMLCILPAMLAGVGVIKLSQSLGPFRNPLNHLAAKLLLPRCKQVHARGEQSLSYLKAIGLPDAITYSSPDVGFLFKDADALFTSTKAVPSLKTVGEYVVLCPSSLVESKMAGVTGQKDAFTALMVDIIHQVNKAGYTAVVLPTAARVTGKSKNNDLPTITRIQKAAGSAVKVVWIDYPIGSGQINQIISGSKALVTSRFHGMVLGLHNEVPTLVLGWGHKYQDMMQMFSQQGYVMDFSVENKVLKSKLDELLSHMDDIARQLKQAKPAVVTASQMQFACLKGI